MIAEKLLPLFINNIKHSKSLPVYGDGKQVRDWCYVKDICQAFYKAIYSKRTGIFNIGSGSSVSFLDLFEISLNLLRIGEILFMNDKSKISCLPIVHLLIMARKLNQLPH